MRIEVREVRIADHVGAVQALIAANWAETGFDFDLEPNWMGYQALQDAGIVFAVAAFDGERIVGYSTACVIPHTFNPAVVFCSSDALFVAPEYRKCSAGFKLIRETERIGAARGAKRMTWHTRAGTPLARSFEKRGYASADVIMMGRL